MHTYAFQWKLYPSEYLSGAMLYELDVWIASHHLELRNDDGSLMAFVSTGLPSHIRSSLEVNLLAALESPDLLSEVDTQLPGDPPFQAMHLSWYNRHCTKVSGRVIATLNCRH